LNLAQSKRAATNRAVRIREVPTLAVADGIAGDVRADRAMLNAIHAGCKVNAMNLARRFQIRRVQPKHAGTEMTKMMI
jgi:hypothetical protein